MMFRTAISLALTVCAATAALAQGPIPPVRMPEQFQAPVEGYSMATPYQLWRIWIEREKGPVTEQALAQAEVLEGRQRVGRPLITAAYNNDYGRYATADVQVYCTVMPVYPDRDRGECTYLFRFANIPIGATYRGETNAFNDWMIGNFDPGLVVRNLRAAGMAPDADLWMNRELFKDAPSPRAMLAEHMQIAQIDSRDCPAFRTAVERLERARPRWTIDLFAVGEDERMVYPGPHALTATYTLNTFVGGQQIALTGDGALEPLVGPVMRAAYDCQQAREAAPRS